MRIKEIGESECIELLCKNFEYPVFMKNTTGTSDAEIIDVDMEDHYLAVTIDGVSEDIDLLPGITYRQIGWTTVNVNFSDLAAVGAKPIGILLSWEVDQNTEISVMEEISKGMNDAARYHGGYILGGDLNEGKRLSFTGCAIGLVRKDKLMTRKGTMAGDILLTTGKIGGANAAAISFAKKMKLKPNLREGLLKRLYEPIARTKASSIISKYATSCIDLSDGLFAGINSIMKNNNVGVIFFDDEDFYMKEAIELINTLNYPRQILAAGGAGDYELLYTVNKSNFSLLEKELQRKGLEAIQIGEITENKAFFVQTTEGLREKNLVYFEQFRYNLNDLQSYLDTLLTEI